eukprot:5787324-Amphidinium_carterae.1
MCEELGGSAGRCVCARARKLLGLGRLLHPRKRVHLHGAVMLMGIIVKFHECLAVPLIEANVVFLHLSELGSMPCRSNVTPAKHVAAPPSGAGDQVFPRSPSSEVSFRHASMVRKWPFRKSTDGPRLSSWGVS